MPEKPPAQRPAPLNRIPGAAFAAVLSALQATPWQTAGEIARILGYDANRTLARLLRNGSVRRRLSDRPLQPYEYALAAAPREAFRG